MQGDAVQEAPDVKGSAMTSFVAVQLRRQLSATTPPSAPWLSMAMLH